MCLQRILIHFSQAYRALTSCYGPMRHGGSKGEQSQARHQSSASPSAKATSGSRGPSPLPVLLGPSLGPPPPPLKAPRPGRGSAAAPQHPPAPPHHAHSLSPRSSLSHVGCPIWDLTRCAPLVPGCYRCLLLPPRCQLPGARVGDGIWGLGP